MNVVGFFPEIEDDSPGEQPLASLVGRCPPKLRERVARYLRQGAILAVAGGRAPDAFDGTMRAVVLNYQTDGTWVWQGGLAHYVKKYGVGVPNKLIDHMSVSGWITPQPSRRILDELMLELDKMLASNEGFSSSHNE